MLSMSGKQAQHSMHQKRATADSKPDGLNEAALGMLDAEHGGTGRHNVLAA